MLIAAGGGMGVGAMALLLKQERGRLQTGPAILKKAIEIAEKQEVVRNILGDEITAQPAKLERKLGTLFDTNNAKVKVPLKGNKDNGVLYVYARRKNKQDRLRLWKIEMFFSKIEGKKLIILEMPGDETVRDDADDEELQRKKREQEEKEKEEKPKSIYADFNGPLPKGIELRRELERRKKADKTKTPLDTTDNQSN